VFVTGVRHYLLCSLGVLSGCSLHVASPLQSMCVCACLRYCRLCIVQILPAGFTHLCLSQSPPISVVFPWMLNGCNLHVSSPLQFMCLCVCVFVSAVGALQFHQFSPMDLVSVCHRAHPYPLCLCTWVPSRCSLHTASPLQCMCARGC
jgi:hypothetical protein